MSNNIRYDIAGIGNAIVDVLSFTDDAFITAQKLTKGTMMLVDEARAGALYDKLGQTTECSGGSVANSLAGMASLGSRAAFIGKVKNDQLGEIFTHDLHAVGVHFSTPPLQEGPSTASCLVCVTPDAQRTMATYIGACSMVSEKDIDPEIIGAAAYTYIEGYLWDAPDAKAAIRKAIALAKNAGRKIAFTLSDVFCVDRHREEFLSLIKSVDILFANEAEMMALYQTRDFAAAIKKLQGACPIAAVTRSEKGSAVILPDRTEDVPTHPVSSIVDTTGAGDLYAGGFLHALARGKSLKECAALGNRCAGHIITQLGARSLKPLHELVA